MVFSEIIVLSIIFFIIMDILSYTDWKNIYNVLNIQLEDVITKQFLSDKKQVSEKEKQKILSSNKDQKAKLQALK